MFPSHDIALLDVAHSLFNGAYFYLLDDAIHELFPNAGGCSFVINCLCKYLSDKRLFRSLYIDVYRDWEVCQDLLGRQVAP